MRFRGSFPGNSHNSFRDYGICQLGVVVTELSES